MTNESRAFVALFRLELRRCIWPVLRGLITPSLLVIWGIVGSEPRPDLVVAGLLGAMGLTAGSVGFQVGRDRADGTLAYFASLPIRGEYLVAIRFVMVALLSALIAVVLAPVGHLLFPGTTWIASIRVAAAAGAFATVAGWILIAPLTKLDWPKVLMGLMAGGIIIGIVLDKTGLGVRVSGYVGARLQSGDLGGMAATLAVLFWCGGALAAWAAFAYSTRSLQPNGGVPTKRAQALLDGGAR